MIERQGRSMSMVCDATSVTFHQTYDKDEFFLMLHEAKSAGWRVVFEKGDWRHYAPEARSAKNEFEIVRLCD